jgi:hypothetical protein
MCPDTDPSDLDSPVMAPAFRGGGPEVALRQGGGHPDTGDCPPSAPGGIPGDGQPSVRVYDSYEAIRPHWEDLNRSYKAGELTLDWKAHELIWDSFYRGRGAGLHIHAVFEDGCCVGIFPMIWLDSDPLEPPRLMLSDDFIIAREYFCVPEKLSRIVALLPPHFSDDLSCFYRPGGEEHFSWAPGGIVDLKGSEEEYLQSLKKKARHTLRRTMALNADLQVEADTQVRMEEIQGILKHQLDYWVQKNGIISTAYADYSRDKIATDLSLMERAEEMGRLISHYYYEGDTLLAANFSVCREEDRVDDYLCLRDCREEQKWRGLGIFAILTNMNTCRSRGIRWYDLSACAKDYKRKFINTASRYAFKSYPEYPVQGEPPEGEDEVCGTVDVSPVFRAVQV